MTLLTIGKLAKAVGAGVETLRYYERLNLLAKPDRTPSGYRIYEPSAIDRLRFIKQAQELGFTLSEIKDLIRLTDDEKADCAQVNAKAREKLVEIEGKIVLLTTMRESLKILADYCPANEKPLSECSIINHLTHSINKENSRG
jgi:MerR family mercuric resistance operon transcriptional regulator